MRYCFLGFVLASLCLFTSSDGAKEREGHSTLIRAYKTWSNTHRVVSKIAATAGAKEFAKRLGNKPLKSLLKPETLKMLRTPPGSFTPWARNPKVTITAKKAGSEVKVPFGVFDLPETEVKAAQELLYDIPMAELNQLVTSSPDVELSDFLECAFNTALDLASLNMRHVLIRVAKVLAELETTLRPVPEYFYDNEVLEGDGSPVKYHHVVQDNWAETLRSNQTIKTYYPKTRQGVVNIVKKAKREDARVRASGNKHSWNHWVWGVDNHYEEAKTPCSGEGEPKDIDYYIAMLPFEQTDRLAFIRADIEGWRRSAKELTFVEGPLDTWTDKDGTPHASVKVGAAALSMFLQEWSLEHEWYIPSIPMSPLFSLGGVISTVSKGSGRKFPPVADLVIGIEYVDEKGEIQYVDDQDDLDAVAGSLGLFGIVLSITFKLDKMPYATFFGGRVQGETLEEYMARPGQPLSDKMLDMMENKFYQSWYVFRNPETDYFLQIVWDVDARKEDSKQLFGGFHNDFATAAQFLLHLINNLMESILEAKGAKDDLYWMFNDVFIEFQKTFVFIDFIPIPTPAVDGIHFLRGLHANAVRSFEINVPLRMNSTGQPDWTSVQEAWWLAHDTISEYEENGLHPVDVTTEYRLNGGSRRFLSSNYDSPAGSLTVDVVCSKTVPKWLWDQFRTDMFERFEKIDTGGLRKPRPHFGKELPTTTEGRTAEDFVMDAYGDQIDMFVERYRSVVTSRGSRYEDSVRRFGTKFFDNILMGCAKKGKTRGREEL